VPAKQRLGRDDRAKLDEHFPPYRPRLLGKLPALAVGKDDAPSTEPLAKQPVLGFQVFDHRCLLPVQATGGQHEQELKQRRGSRHFGRDVGCTILPRQLSRLACYGDPGSRDARSSFRTVRHRAAQIAMHGYLFSAMATST